ncbi:hypothetical protein E0H77_00625 [Acinetobacter sp. ANC 4633]|uniref:hypothetical protein n=1 Tax=Acinetobacter sp. ANC 4633 TaxID=2529845 RepID=UPI0010386787|nr:hypothetical protein [Acinetobacter sp. ANC 4633]TCB28683.1 hypothetical protein E0H77_00625 [Acinetobacter sp. ANC 4633]
MSQFEYLRAYTQAELDQQAVWAEEFDHWWEDEGQYHRAGGGQYERTFAWWAWLSREQQHKAKIDAALRELGGAIRFVEEDTTDDIDFIKGAVLHSYRRIEQALKCDEPKEEPQACDHIMVEKTQFGDLERSFECIFCDHKTTEEWVTTHE